ncbi:hypothetical protein SDC9_201178 [bioreactor metagenome]|uniref:Uncharacterized protein n=1 Tax=bioreactor metagenome TaxID=1076179 RepID=A0A645IZ32_9ZZZZ
MPEEDRHPIELAGRDGTQGPGHVGGGVRADHAQRILGAGEHHRLAEIGQREAQRR